MVRTVEHAVFGEAALNSHNNLDLPRDAVSLLVVLWSLIVLPKRERQAARDASAEGDLQDEMFSAERPMPRVWGVGWIGADRTKHDVLLGAVRGRDALLPCPAHVQRLASLLEREEELGNLVGLEIRL